MLHDEILATISEENNDDVIWGKYDNHYDWIWSKDRPYLSPHTLSIGSQVLLRDWTVAKKLHDLGVKKVLDIGSDTGHFMAVLHHFGIKAVGVDASKEATLFVNKKEVNVCYNVGIQTLITLPLEGYDCITCMNITQAVWDNEQLKKDFIRWITKHASYTVLSDFTHQDRSWGGLTKIHDFNVLPIYFSKIVYRIASFFHVESMLNYLCIQKVYKVSNVR